MTGSTRLANPQEVSSQDGAQSRKVRGWLIAVAATAILGWLLTFTRADIPAWLANPDAPVPPPDEGMLGLSGSFWIVVLNTGTFLVCAALIVGFLWNRRRGGSAHPGFAVFIGLTTIVAYDPIFNWGMYVIYNPNLRHWPTTWPWAHISPSVEPLWPLGAYPFFFLTPGLITFYLHRRFIARRAAPGSFTMRHPLWSIFLFSLPIALAMEMVGESLLLQMRIWTYYQYWGPALRLFSHSWLPFIEILLATLTMSFLATLMHRNDKGQSPAKRLSMRLGGSTRPDGTPRRIRIGEKTTAILLMQAVFIAYIGFFCVLRLAGVQTNVAGYYPYPVIKTIDPDGHAQRAGIPGPYYTGDPWSTADAYETPR